MGVLSRSPTRLVFLLSIAAPGQVLLLPLLGVTVLCGLMALGVLQAAFKSGTRAGFAVAAAALAVLVLLLLLDLTLAGAIYVLDRPRDTVRVYRGPLLVHRFVLSDLADVEMKTSIARSGEYTATARLVFRSGAALPLNRIPTASLAELESFQREVRELTGIPAQPSAAVGGTAAAAGALIKQAAPQLLRALWASKCLQGVAHPSEAAAFLGQYLNEHRDDPTLGELLRTLQGTSQDRAAVAASLLEAAGTLRVRGDVAKAARCEEMARYLQP